MRREARRNDGSRPWRPQRATALPVPLDLWRQKQLKVRVRPWFWSGDDDGVSVAETRILNDYNMVGDDVWRQVGVGERINTSTTNPLNAEAWVFAAQHGWIDVLHDHGQKQRRYGNQRHTDDYAHGSFEDVHARECLSLLGGRQASALSKWASSPISLC